jgi:hypothetical protein
MTAASARLLTHTATLNDTGATEAMIYLTDLHRQGP